MNRKILIIIALTFFAAFSSCKKSPLSIGKTVTQTRQLDHFDTLVIRDDINVILVKSDENRVEITTGENLIDNIETKISDSTLVISNESTMNFIRTYDYKIDVTLYFKDICRVTHSSSGYLKTSNQFNDDTTYTPHQGDTLLIHPLYELIIDGSCGDIDMEFNDCDRLYVDYKNGTSNVVIHGNDNHNLEIYSKSFGIVDASDYRCDYVKIRSRSSNDCWVNASKYLQSRIDKNGDIYYKGDPEKIVETYGQNANGRLIRSF